MITPFTQPPIAALELDEEAQALITGIRKISGEIAGLEAARAVLREHLEKILGDCETGLINGHPAVTWKWDKPSTTTDTARLKSELPEIWAEYQKPRKTSRPLKFLDGADG
jgi:predicted phage-related endonuclease